MARRKASKHRCISAEAGISRAAKHYRDMRSRTKLGIGIGILALGLCVAGCTAPQSDVEKPAEVKEEAGGGRTLTLAFEAPTRAGLARGGVTPLWEAGDDIWLSSMDGGYEIVTLEAGDITELEGGANCATIKTELTGTLYAVYPSSAVVYPSEAVTDDGIVLRLPSTTDGSFAKAHMAVAKSDKDHLFFRNAVSILEFSGFNSTISSIEVEDKKLCATFSVQYGDPLGISSRIQGNGLITVSGMTPGSPVYIPVAPGATIPADAVFTFRNSAGAVIRRTTHDTALTPEAGGIYELGAATLPAVPNDAVPGLFSVSPSHQVFFARGNLTSLGDFSSSQCDFGAYSYPSSDVKGWRLLTPDELEYLFTERKTADGTSPTVNGTPNAVYTKCNVAGVNGVLLFPDAFVWPDGKNAPNESFLYTVNDYSSDFDHTFTAAEFATLEAAGCVFLPAAGAGPGSDASGVEAGLQGFYGTDSDVVLRFSDEGLDYNSSSPLLPSFRLVTDA